MSLSYRHRGCPAGVHTAIRDDSIARKGPVATSPGRLEPADDASMATSSVMSGFINGHIWVTFGSHRPRRRETRNRIARPQANSNSNFFISILLNGSSNRWLAAYLFAITASLQRRIFRGNFQFRAAFFLIRDQCCRRVPDLRKIVLAPYLLKTSLPSLGVPNVWTPIVRIIADDLPSADLSRTTPPGGVQRVSPDGSNEMPA